MRRPREESPGATSSRRRRWVRCLHSQGVRPSVSMLRTRPCARVSPRTCTVLPPHLRDAGMQGKFKPLCLWASSILGESRTPHPRDLLYPGQNPLYHPLLEPWPWHPLSPSLRAPEPGMAVRAVLPMQRSQTQMAEGNEGPGPWAPRFQHSLPCTGRGARSPLLPAYTPPPRIRSYSLEKQ